MSEAKRDALDKLVRELSPATTLLESASREVRLLAAATPKNLLEERTRLARALSLGTPASPRWLYGKVDVSGTRVRLSRLARALESAEEPLARHYRARAQELELECRFVENVGFRSVEPLARERFGGATDDPGLLHALGFLTAPPLAQEAVEGRVEPQTSASTPEETLASDDPSPRSLASRMRQELGARKLPFAVRVVPGLSALAATGETYVLVASGRPTRPEDVERTVLHEIEGHVLPRVRAREGSLPLARFGTARGSDDQEGYALFLEERAGFLGPRRMRELCARRLAIAFAMSGATYMESARKLHEDHGLEPLDAVRVAERAYRGGDGNCLGLARDRPYLESWLRVREASRTEPHLLDVLAKGQISLDAARTWERDFPEPPKT